jgi:hypothetical protein
MADCLEYIQEKWFKYNGGLISCAQRKKQSTKPAKSVKQLSKHKDHGKCSVVKLAETNGITEKPKVLPALTVVKPLKQVESIKQHKPRQKRIEIILNRIFRSINIYRLSLRLSRDKENATIYF